VILAAGLLVLLGLGLFVAGILTGETALYWGCVAACVVAAVLLFQARRQLTAATRARSAAAPVAPVGQSPADEPRSTAGASARGVTDSAAPTPAGAQDLGEPPVEEVEVTDLLLVVDLTDEVLVVDEHPRYHLAGCRYVAGRTTIPLPLDEARTDGFTPCGACAPDRTLAAQVRARKASGG
jgi:hypothetical protein